MIDKLEHVQRLVFKARNDLRSAQDLMQTPSPATDVVCFHCQQAVEKMLKAWLHWHEITVPRTHNLAEIVELCKRTDPAFSQLLGVEILTPYAVEVRYVDDSPQRHREHRGGRMRAIQEKRLRRRSVRFGTSSSLCVTLCFCGKEEL